MRKRRFASIMVFCAVLLQAISAAEKMQKQDERVQFYKETINALSSNLGMISNDRGSVVKFPYPTPISNEFDEAVSTYFTTRNKYQNKQFIEGYGEVRRLVILLYQEYKWILTQQSFHDEFAAYRSYPSMMETWTKVTKRYPAFK